MGKARLIIEADSSAVTRVFAEIRRESRAVAGALGGDFVKSARAATGAFKKMRQEVVREFEALRKTEDALGRAREQRSTRARRSAQQEAAVVGAAYRSSGKEGEKAEERTTKAQDREANKRKNAAEKEAEKKIREAKRAQREVEKAEKATTNAIARESRTRERAMGSRLRAVGGAISTVAGGAWSAAQGLHGEAQDARTRRAATARTMGSALYQTGAYAPEVRMRTAQMHAFARQTGISSDELAGAANAVQTEFAGLGEKGMSGDQRGKLFNKFLNRTLEARNRGIDVGEYTRFAGMLDSSGFDEKTSDMLLRFGAGASQRGAVEMGSISREAMGSIQQRIALAQARAKSSGGDVQAASEMAIRQSYAELQVAKGMGFAPGQAGNAFAAMNTALQGSTVQRKMYNNLAHKLGDKNPLLAQLFDTDKTGKHSLKTQYRDALPLAEILQKNGVDPVQFGNLFASGGHGDPQSLQANWRKLAGSLTSTDIQGKTGAQRVRELMNESVALTAEDDKRGADVFDDDAAQLVKNQEKHDAALSDNTNWLKQLSDQIANWKAENPIASTAIEAGGAIAATGTWSMIRNAALKRAAAKAAEETASRGVVTLGEQAAEKGIPSVATRALGAGARLGLRLAGGAAFMSDFLHSTDTVSGDDEHDEIAKGAWKSWSAEKRQAMTAQIAASMEQSAQTGGLQGIALEGGAQFMREGASKGDEAIKSGTFVRILADAIAGGLTGAKINVNVSPQQLEQARSGTAANNARTPVQ